MVAAGSRVVGGRMMAAVAGPSAAEHDAAGGNDSNASPVLDFIHIVYYIVQYNPILKSQQTSLDVMTAATNRKLVTSTATHISNAFVYRDYRFRSSNKT